MSYPPRFYEGQRTGSHISAQHAVPIIMDLVRPESVVDVGCGIGTWLIEFARLGAEITGIDGPWASEAGLIIPAADFLPIDLRLSARDGAIEGIGRYSLCLSLEVAEHLPAECSDGFVSLLTSLADCIVFSAAIPYQGGNGHINEQWDSYWIEIFDRHGFDASDVIRAALWDACTVEPWYRQNTLLFIKRESADAQLLRRMDEMMLRAQSGIPTRVHPDFYEMCHRFYRSDEYLSGLCLSALLVAAARRAGYRVRGGFRRLVRLVRGVLRTQP